MKSQKVTLWFAGKFLLKYLRTRSFVVVDAQRIGKAADAGSLIAKPVDRIMMFLSFSYREVHNFRRQLQRATLQGGNVEIDVIKPGPDSLRQHLLDAMKGEEK